MFTPGALLRNGNNITPVDWEEVTVKAAATNLMEVMTGIEGRYDCQTYQYHPPTTYQTWKEVIVRNKIQLEVVDNITILSLLH